MFNSNQSCPPGSKGPELPSLKTWATRLEGRKDDEMAMDFMPRSHMRGQY